MFLFVPHAAPQELGSLGSSQRGAGARIRTRLDRLITTAATDPAEGREHLDELLGELHARRSDANDRLDVQTLDAVSREAVALRCELALGEVELLPGFRGDFVASVAPAAAWSDWSTGVPASITVAQAILESSWGRKAPGHNLFGLKGEGPAGSNSRTGIEYRKGKRKVKRSAFRAYNDASESIADHARILATSRHYARARAVAEDTAAYARALQGTYATDPRYAGKLTSMIKRYHLDRLDWNARSPWR